MAPISAQELHLFHRIDREVFFCLVTKLARDPGQSLLVMSLWLWLENTGYPNIISKIVALSHSLVNSLANEAVLCLRCLEAEIPPRIPAGGGLPLTTILVQKEISLHLFNQKRFAAITGIRSILNNVSSRIFVDILQHVLSGPSSSTSLPAYNPRRPLIVPGFPHPLFGDLTIPPNPENQIDLSDETLWGGRRPSDHVTDDDKTMFLTFSRGFPVSEEEVRHLFTSAYGAESVKGIYMGTVDVNEQALFATMVLDTVETLDRILNGKRIAKFRVNGKHIWARKYERRD